MSLHTHTGRNRIHWSEGAAKAGDVRHERFVASKEGAFWSSSVIVVVSEPKGNGNSEGLKSDKSV